jgi:hypothetical protein
MTDSALIWHTQTELVTWAGSLHVSYAGHCSLSALYSIYTTFRNFTLLRLQMIGCYYTDTSFYITLQYIPWIQS